jgi:predicted phosphodiesterase
MKKGHKDTVLQLGDLGIGFNVPPILGVAFKDTGKPVAAVVAKLPKNFHFFVGNHDNRKLAKTLPSCLGDFGEFENVFFVSGGQSHDQWARVEGVSWWRDEELNQKQAGQCLLEWQISSKDILIAHDCPQSIAEGHFRVFDRCITRTLLQSMIETRRPKLVVFGHHHKHLDIVVDGTRFVCLNIGESIKI